MAIRNIRKDGDEALRKTCREVTKFDDRLRILIDDMFDTMYDANGVGLAGPQVGVLKRIFVIDTDEEGEKLVFINPVILSMSGSQHTQEGCLSVPGRAGICERPEEVTVRAQDAFGNFFEYTGRDLMAKAICHENDHLDGILFIDKLLEEEELD